MIIDDTRAFFPQENTTSPRPKQCSSLVNYRVKGFLRFCSYLPMGGWGGLACSGNPHHRLSTECACPVPAACLCTSIPGSKAGADSLRIQPAHCIVLDCTLRRPFVGERAAILICTHARMRAMRPIIQSYQWGNWTSFALCDFGGKYRVGEGHRARDPELHNRDYLETAVWPGRSALSLSRLFFRVGNRFCTTRAGRQTDRQIGKSQLSDDDVDEC